MHKSPDKLKEAHRHSKLYMDQFNIRDFLLASNGTLDLVLDSIKINKINLIIEIHWPDFNTSFYHADRMQGDKLSVYDLKSLQLSNYSSKE